MSQSTIARVKGLGFALPGERVPLTRLNLSSEESARLKGLKQEFFHWSPGSSTDLMTEAGALALANANTKKNEIGMVITAPSLITSYGLEIPAIEIRNRLGLHRAECLNLGQGCVGLFRAMQLANDRLVLHPEQGEVLVLAGCVASRLTRNHTHGSFFWGDGGAAIVMSATKGLGLQFRGYAECSAERDTGAMRIGFGDAKPIDQCNLEQDFQIQVSFASDLDQLRYIEGEQNRFLAVIHDLMRQGGITMDELTAVVMPSLGHNRLRTLLLNHNPLREKIITDSRYAHMGAVDALLFLQQNLEHKGVCTSPEWYITLTPAFTAQWGGVLLKREP
ncbi:MAG: hypothetical protein HQL93_13310 [Magnetococcales bacterium]|nr:hypothetical protein [Magnetococcales bacterium]